MEQKEFLSARFSELSERARQREQLTHSEFLSVSEQAVFLDQNRGKPGGQFRLYGGYPDAERQVLFFLPPWMAEYGTDEGLSAELSGQLSCVLICPEQKKFAEALSHRDYLGALMNLGIARDQTGDILTEDGEACLFCMREIAGYICENLTRIRHTSVCCREIACEDCRMRQHYTERSVNVASERLDAVIAAVFRLSRAEASALIASEKVFADGQTVSQPGAALREGARISVRGYGKFLYDGPEHLTKKGRLYVRVRQYGSTGV